MNPESGNGNGTGKRLINITDVLMVLLTIITFSKIAHLRSIYIGMLSPFGLFPLKGNGTYMEPFHEKVVVGSKASFYFVNELLHHA